MKALKGLLVYIGIVLACILGIAILLFAGMYFFPSFRIMGVGVVHGSDKQSGVVADLSTYSGLEEIELNISTKMFNINIDNGDEDKITYNFSKSVFGIAYDITEYKFVKDISLDGNVLKCNISVTEPDGLISNNSSYINIYFPKSYASSILISTRSGDVKIGFDNALNNINSLTINSTSGDFALNGVNNSGEEKNLKIKSLNLTTNKGYFDLSAIDNLTVTNPIKLQAVNGTFAFKNVKSSFDVTGKGIKLDANKIETDYKGFKFICENGFLNIDKLTTPVSSENTIVAENCDVKISEIYGRTGIITTYGNITIGTLNDYSSLQSEHGNITVSKALNNLVIETYFGNISVDSYEKNGRFISTRGNITVKSTGDYVQGVYTEIENTEGVIDVDNKINRLLVTTNGSSKVTITYREIKGGLSTTDVFQHKVKLHNDSSAVIYMPINNYNTPYKFLAKGNISGEIFGLTPSYGGYSVKSSDEYQYFPINSEENEELCRQSCYFEFYGTINFKSSHMLYK